MNYVSVADLNSYIINNIHKLPHDVDLIVGIPRSGMLPANLIALYLNKPYTDIDNFLEGRVYGIGARKKFVQEKTIKKVLVVDDSIGSGQALKEAKEKLSDLKEIYDLTYAAVIASPESKQLIDYYCEEVPFPRVFQWNLFHHPDFIPQSCFDIDGVLCEDPPVDDDGPIYLEYIKNAIPKYIPTIEIHTLVTCRLEKYRAATEEWLRKNGVKYKNLVMLNMKSREERITWGQHGKYKGDVFAKSDASFFVESSLMQAKQIVRIAKKPVFCTENFQMLTYKKEVNAITFFLFRVKRKLNYWRNSLKGN